MKIYVFDHWVRFMAPVVEYWRQQGHEVKHGRHWGPGLVDWADACYFYPVDNNLIQASRRQEKPQDTRIVAEAVDIDIYAGHPGAINWDYVDALVVMAPHMLRLLRTKTQLRDGLEVHVVPGGVDLDKFTLRQKPRGYNVAWIGRFWIAKNVFGALQIFRQLIKADPISPWRLFLRGDKWDPPWWKVHCLAYLADNPKLAERVAIVERVDDVNEWLEDMDYLLQTSFKEAFGYVVAEAAAKGIQPVIQNTNGARETWPDGWVFDTHGRAVHMLQASYEPKRVRGIIAERYPLEARLRALDRIMGLV